MNDFAARAEPGVSSGSRVSSTSPPSMPSQAAVDAALDAKRELVLDLSELSFLDSTGIRAILAVAGRVGGGIVLRSPKPPVRRVLDLVGIEGTRASASRIDGRPGWREKRREP